MKILVNKSTGEVAFSRREAIKLSIFNLIHYKVFGFSWYKVAEEDL